MDSKMSTKETRKKGMKETADAVKKTDAITKETNKNTEQKEKIAVKDASHKKEIDPKKITSKGTGSLVTADAVDARASIEEMTIFCKKKGFVFPSSELYGGFAGFFDFGPLGVEMFNNIKQNWWRFFVQQRENIVGIDASIISHPRTWVASGHVATFGDLVLQCAKCKKKYRADHFIEDNLFISTEGLSSEQIHALVQKNKLACPECKGHFADVQKFNLLFSTQVGPLQDSKATAYLRGETAQAMFMDFKQVAETSRQRLPFGIAQIGRCFRNEISPRDFLFRSREFHIAEFEFFIHPEDTSATSAALSKEQLAQSLRLLSAEAQEKAEKHISLLGRKKKEAVETETTIKKMLDEKRLDAWHAYWLAEQLNWFEKLGLDPRHLRVREHLKSELSHYSSATFDIEYHFPFGRKELAGNANRGQYDLGQHSTESKTTIQIFDEASKKNVVPRVIEPTFGMERAFLALLFECFENDSKRGNIVLHLPPSLAPFKVAIFPLINKEGLPECAREVYRDLASHLVCFYDTAGSIGRRYARQDEIGTPFCVTVDFDSLKKKDVTIRDRDTTKQIRVKIKDLRELLQKLIAGDISFKDLC